MTVIRPNSITGVTSITALADDLNFYRSDGSLQPVITANINSTGVSTVTDLRVGTAVTANSNGIQVGAGKSVRIFGSASGYSDLIAPAVAGDQLFTLHTAGGTLVTADGTQTLTNKTIQGGAIAAGTSVASTSGTSIDFTGIPSWAKRITVMLDGVSHDATSTIQIQIGSGSFVTSGYLSLVPTIDVTGAVSNTSSITGFAFQKPAVSTDTISGVANLVLISSNTWLITGTSFRSGSTNLGGFIVANAIVLSGALDRVRITTVSGTATFDAGTINILYEG